MPSSSLHPTPNTEERKPIQAAKRLPCLVAKAAADKSDSKLCLTVYPPTNKTWELQSALSVMLMLSDASIRSSLILKDFKVLVTV